MKKKFRIAVILLNYNSEEDLFACVEQIRIQQNIEIVTIIVDNASQPQSVDAIQAWSKAHIPAAYCSDTIDLFASICERSLDQHAFSDFFIYNHENNGYSAGNNIGIKLADYLNVDAVLIANPDMRFYDQNYIAQLSNVLFADEEYFVAASKIIGLDGKDQNPLREAEFTEELFWPRQLFPKIFTIKPYLIPYKSDQIITVPKVVGCCLLVRMDFLREIGYFDETTFLYAEEPILAAQVRQKKGKIVFTPFVEALHAHQANTKGNSSKRMQLFIKSRKYYLKKYSGYNQIQLMLLNFSYALLAIMHQIKASLTK